jgi:hypothetical protein
MTLPEIDEEMAALDIRIADHKRQIRYNAEIHAEAPFRTEHADMLHDSFMQGQRNELDALQDRRDELEMMIPDTAEALAA